MRSGRRCLLSEAPAGVRQPSRFRDLAKAVRTRQWAKNALLFGGLIFAGRLRNPTGALAVELTQVLLAFICFCALSGAAYILNDWRDLENDRRHPIKCHRPLAAGRISLATAKSLVLGLLLCAVITSLAVVLLNRQAWGFPVAATGYFALTLAYSFALKHEVIVDVLCVASGFVLRVVAGCLAIPVEISPWIVFCTFNLALFIALSKRRAELLELGEAAGTRKVLVGYNLSMLDTFISVASSLTIIAYSLYTFESKQEKALGDLHQSHLMMITIPFVVYGVFRYLLLAHSSPVGGEPEQMLRDKPLMINVGLWIAVVACLTLLGR